MNIILLYIIYIKFWIGTGFFFFLTILSFLHPEDLKIKEHDKDQTYRSRMILLIDFIIYLVVTILLHYNIKKRKSQNFKKIKNNINVNEIELNQKITINNKLS